MDTVKISNFILMARTKAGLTQKELADKIGVSDKTISKWETGKSLPDISYYETLCDALNIKVNELLSGEYLNEEIYLEKAETNIVEIIRENKFSKKKVVAKLFAGLALFIAAALLIGILSSLNLSEVIAGLFDLFWFLSTLVQCLYPESVHLMISYPYLGTLPFLQVSYSVLSHLLWP